PDGGVVMDNHPALSQLGTQVNFAHLIRKNSQEQMENAITQGKSDLETYSEGVNSTFRRLSELSDNQSHTASTLSEIQQMHTHRLAHSLQELQQLGKQFSFLTGQSERHAFQTLGTVYFDVHLNAT